MSDKFFKLNITFAIVDTLVCLVAILAFLYLSVFFSRWWLMLFALIPVLLYNQHKIIVDEGIRQAKVDALSQKRE